VSIFLISSLILKNCNGTCFFGNIAVACIDYIQFLACRFGKSDHKHVATFYKLLNNHQLLKICLMTLQIIE